MTTTIQNPFGVEVQGLPNYDEWRQIRFNLDLACTQFPERRAVEYKKCKDDILYWLWHYGWIHCPWNPEDEQEQMFLPWKFQEDLIAQLVEGMREATDRVKPRKRNFVIEKARDMAASWTACAVALWDWLFHRGNHMFVSYREDKVDNPEDMDSLFEKMRFILYRLPEWMLPKGFNERRHDLKLKLVNPEGATITGDTTTKRSSRSGRKKVIWFDEFAFFMNGLDLGAWGASSQSTRMRVVISTPNGMHNLFYQLRTLEVDEETGESRYMFDVNQTVITLAWWKHPLKAQGLRTENGKLLSPWYLEEKRSEDSQVFAREVEIDYRLSQKGWVFDEYTYEHKFKKLQPDPKKPVLRGWDAGAHFCVVFGQLDDYGRFLILKEMYFENKGIDYIAEKVLAYSGNHFAGYTFEDYGDPAGASVYTSNTIGQRSEWAELQLKHRIVVRWQFMNKIANIHRVESRIIAIRKKIRGRSEKHNTPMLLVDPLTCPIVDRALGGEYTRKVNSTTGQIEDEIDESHPTEDVIDCIGYILLGKGEGGGMPGQASRQAQGPKPAKKVIRWVSPGGTGRQFAKAA